MTTRLYDNTRLSDFRSCPRYFYFRHVRDLVPVTKSAALIFGGAWHTAMDVVWREVPKYPKEKTGDLAHLALDAFVKEWTEAGQPHPDEIGPETLGELGARHPMTALEMLYEYIDLRRPMLTGASFELLEVEKPFAVPLDPDQPSLYYIGRLDKVFRIRDKIRVAEHKTTSLYSKAEGIRSSWLDGFSPNSQIDGYLFAGMMYYGEAFDSVWIDAALVHKTVHDAFVWHPVERRVAHLDAWLWETHQWVEMVEACKAVEQEDLASGVYMASYPKNTSKCMDFGGCPYLDLCKMWENPAAHGEVPAGYKEQHWDPLPILDKDGKLGEEIGS